MPVLCSCATCRFCCILLAKVDGMATSLAKPTWAELSSSGETSTLASMIPAGVALAWFASSILPLSLFDWYWLTATSCPCLFRRLQQQIDERLATILEPSLQVGCCGLCNASGQGAALCQEAFHECGEGPASEAAAKEGVWKLAQFLFLDVVLQVLPRTQKGPRCLLAAAGTRCGCIALTASLPKDMRSSSARQEQREDQPRGLSALC